MDTSIKFSARIERSSRSDRESRAAADIARLTKEGGYSGTDARFIRSLGSGAVEDAMRTARRADNIRGTSQPVRAANRRLRNPEHVAEVNAQAARSKSARTAKNARKASEERAAAARKKSNSNTKKGNNKNQQPAAKGKGGGDPIFSVILPSGQKIRYGFHGEPGKTHDLVSTPGWQLNGLFEQGIPFAGKRWTSATMISELTLEQGAHNVSLKMDGSTPVITYGKGDTEKMVSGKTYSLHVDQNGQSRDGVSVKWNEEKGALTIDTPEAILTMKASKLGKLLGLGYLSTDSSIQLKNENAGAGWHGIWGQLFDVAHREEAYGDEAFQNGAMLFQAQGGGVLATLSENDDGDQVVLSRRGDRTVQEHYVTSGPNAVDDDFAQEPVLYVQALLDILDEGTPEQKRNAESVIGDFIKALPVDKQESAWQALDARGIKIKKGETDLKPKFVLAC